MIKKKILIIGFGNMGLSHFNSFYNKNYEIHIVEKKINKNIQSIKTLQKKKLLNKNISIFKKIPNRKKYLLTISATRSKERLDLIKKFFKNNKTQFLLLEKFCFITQEQFDHFKIKLNNKTKTFVNSWGYILAKKMAIKKKLKCFKITCHIKEGYLLSNITHLFHFFSYLNNKKAINIFQKNNYKIKKNKRNIFYNELIGSIKVEDCNKNILTIESKKKMNDYMTFFIYQKKPKIKYKISFKNNLDIYYYNSGIKVKKFKFPLSKITTSIFLNKCLDKNFDYFPSFYNDYKISSLILKNIKAKIS